VRRTFARSGRVTGTAPMRPARRTAVFLAAGTAGLALAASLSGCGAGQISETSLVQSAVQGYSVNVGDLQIRDALLEFPTAGEAWPAGSDIPLVVRIINSGTSADQLVGASSDAGPVELRASGASASPPVSASPSTSPSASTSPSPSTSPSSSITPTPTGSTSPSPAASPTPTGPQFPLTLAPNGILTLDDSGTQLVLTGTKERLDASALVTVTLRFRTAGSVELKVPIAPPATPLPRTSQTHEEGENEGA
jgi:copper(I)-binding protein